MLWDLSKSDDDNPVQTFIGHTDSIYAIAVVPDEKHFLSGSIDTTIKLWNYENSNAIKTFTGHSSWLASLAVFPDGNRFLSGSNDHTVKLWDIHDSTTTTCIQTFDETETVYAIAILSNETFVTGQRDSTEIHLWNINNNLAIVKTYDEHSFYIRSLAAVLPDGR